MVRKRKDPAATKPRQQSKKGKAPKNEKPVEQAAAPPELEEREDLRLKS